MPTVLRLDGLRIAIYPNDHRPAHIHAIGRGCEAVFHLNCPEGPVDLRESYRFAKRRIAKLRRQLSKHVADLCRAWERIHGTEQ